MKYTNDKFGILVSIGITVMALGFVTSLTLVDEGSIQPQGQEIIDYTVTEIQEIPDTVQDVTSDVIDTTETIIDDSDSVGELVDNTSDVIEEVLPDVAPVVKKSDGKLLELVSIPPGTGVPGCEESDTCYLPFEAKMAPGGEVIWTNDDTLGHTVTSGSPYEDGPNGLFDSGLLMPGDTYSIKLDLAFEYDYFCLVHPWMQGTIVVE